MKNTEDPELPDLLPPRKRRRFRVKLPAPDPTNPNRCCFYVRCSSQAQLLSIPAQLVQLRRMLPELGLTLMEERYNGPSDNNADPRFAVSPEDQAPGVFMDSAVSAYKMNLAERPGGRRMLNALKPGDTVMCVRLDRMFRSVADFCLVSEWMLDRHIRLFVCNPRIDLGTATGRLLARNLASLAQWESERKSERIKEALAMKRIRDGIAPPSAPPKERTIDLGSDYRRSDPPPAKPLHVEARPGRIFLYARVSHRESAASGLGLLAQLDHARAYAQLLVAANPQLSIAEVFSDPVQSAWSIPLKERRAGGAMCQLLQTGDHVVFASLDRGFRSIRDLANTIPDWHARGITAHFVAEGINLSDVGGQMLAMTVVQFAQYEAELASARNTETHALLRRTGMYHGGSLPAFRDLRQFEKYRKLTLNRAYLAQYRLVNIYRLQGMKMRPALERLEAILAEREGRVAVPLSGAHKNSKIGRALPPDYPFDSRNIAFPRWSVDQYRKAKDEYERELSLWRTIAAERRDRRDHPVMGLTRSSLATGRSPAHPSRADVRP